MPGDLDRKSLLQKVNFGSSVAELDTILTEMYIETTTLTDFVQDRYDVIRGAKGTGKSALLLYITRNAAEYRTLENVTLIKATEHTGDPGFQHAFGRIDESAPEEVFIEAWKIYIINLLWSALEEKVNNLGDLKGYLVKKKVLDRGPGFLDWLKHAISRAKASISVDSYEYSIQLGGVEEGELYVDYNYVFREINNLLGANGYRYWVLFDRLDDAFPSWDLRSKKAMRGLLSMHKDILGFRNFKVKTFVRTDIYDRLTTDEGFRSLSHLNAVTSPPITWDTTKIKQFIEKRLSCFQLPNTDNVIESVFGAKVDVGSKQPSSYRWLFNHLRDGNGLITPRDIIEFLDAARMHTLSEIESNCASYTDDRIFTKSSMKKAWEVVSSDKIQTQIYAENPELRPYIESFREGKAEYSRASLSRLDNSLSEDIIKGLQYVGFLEKYGANFKILFLDHICILDKERHNCIKGGPPHTRSPPFGTFRLHPW